MFPGVDEAEGGFGEGGANGEEGGEVLDCEVGGDGHGDGWWRKG